MFWDKSLADLCETLWTIHAAQGEGRLSVASRAGQEEKDGQDAKEKEENSAWDPLHPR